MVTFIRNLEDRYFLFLDTPTLKLNIIIILPNDRREDFPDYLYNKKLSCLEIEILNLKRLCDKNFRRLTRIHNHCVGKSAYRRQ